MNIGSNISRLRREMGLTQEQLGNLVSVSAQAVSKWENGGMPDTELIPAIADALHVTIDTLFGREDAKSADMQELFSNWYMRQPEEKRQYELFKLLIRAQNSPVQVENALRPDDLMELMRLPLKSSKGSYISNGERITVFMRSQFTDDHGMRLLIPAEDCPLFLLLPEPEEGYLSNLLEPAQYRKLYSALAIEGSMELLYFLYSKKINYYSGAALADACGFDEEGLLPALDALSGIDLIKKRSVIEADGEHSVYALNEDPAFMAFLLFSRWLIEAPGYIWSWSSREKPLLNMEEKTNGKKADK